MRFSRLRTYCLVESLGSGLADCASSCSKISLHALRAGAAMSGALLQFQQQRKLVAATAQQLHRVLPVDGAAFADQREQVACRSLPLLSCTWVERIWSFIRSNAVLDTLVHVGVAGVEHVVQCPGASAPRTAAAARRSKARWECSPAESPRRAAARRSTALPARKTPRRTCACRTLRRPPRCAGSGTGTESISAISSARLISSTISQARALHRLGDGDDGVRPGAAPDLVVVHRRMQRVQLQLGIAEPVAEFGDLRLVAIVQMLARAEDLYRGNSGLLDSGRASPTSAGG